MTHRLPQLPKPTFPYRDDDSREMSYSRPRQRRTVLWKPTPACQWALPQSSRRLYPEGRGK